MIVIVSGYRRTGTSAMMRALWKGGVSVVRAGWMDSAAQGEDADGYCPNPAGLFEVGAPVYRNPGVLARGFGQARGAPATAYKVFFDGLPTLPGRTAKDPYRVIFMERDEQEIRDSLARTLAWQQARGEEPVAPNQWPVDVYREFDARMIRLVLGICAVREDMQVLRVWYPELVREPVAILERVAGFLAVPGFSVEKAAATVDAALYRVVACKAGAGGV